MPIFEKVPFWAWFWRVIAKIKACRVVASRCTIYQKDPPNPPVVKKMMICQTKKISFWGMHTRRDYLPKFHEKSSKIQTRLLTNGFS